MKKYFKFILLFMVLLPNVVYAANLKLEKKEQPTNENYVIYNIIYDSTGATDESVKIDINPAGEGIEYEFGTIENGLIGTCNNSSCTINVKDVTSTNLILTTLKIKNMTSEVKSVIPSILGTYSATANAIQINGSITETTTTTVTTTVPVVPNNNLSELNISVGTIDKTFDKNITEYNITEIRDTVNSITLSPTCETECTWEVTCPLGECSVTNPTKNARVSLQTGANKISIVVKSLDNSINKTYILNAYRGEIQTSSAYLSDIKIKDSELSPNFDSMINDYTASVGLDVKKLEIDVIPEDPEAKVVIKGNENFKEGENTVTITVTSSDGENKQVYSIIVNQEELEEETEEKEEKPVVSTPVKKKNNNLWLIITLSILTLGLITVVFIIIFKKKKNKKNDNNKNNKSGGQKINRTASELLDEENSIEKENTESLNILDETRRQLNEEPKQNIDDALDDLMMTKRLELGDLDIYS